MTMNFNLGDTGPLTSQSAGCTRTNEAEVAMKVGHEFEYKGIPYRVASVGQNRWTNSGTVTKVFAVNTVTGLGGRHFDLRADGQPFRFSPD